MARVVVKANGEVEWSLGPSGVAKCIPAREKTLAEAAWYDGKSRYASDSCSHRDKSRLDAAEV